MCRLDAHGSRLFECIISVFNLRRDAELLIQSEQTESAACLSWVLRAEKVQADIFNMSAKLQERLLAVKAGEDGTSVTDPTEVDMYRYRIEELEAELREIKRQRLN